MAKVKSAHAIGRTGFGVNDASSFSLGVSTPLDFDIRERWKTEINWGFGFDKVLNSNNCETVLKRSLSELAEGTCLLYNSHKDVKSSDETNNLQLSRETDGPGKNTENSCQELTTNTRVLMAPITDTYYKSVPSDISSNDLTDNDFKCLESSPEINELLLQNDFNHVSKVSDFCDWVDSASSSPSKSNTNSRLNYVSFPKCESDTFNSELLSLIENGDTQGKYIENLTEPDAGNSISSVSGNSNNENFSGKSLSELALCHLKLDELSQTSNNSSSDIDFNVLLLPVNTDECHIFDTHCESLSNVLLETSSPERKRNGLSSGLPLKENKAVNYENKNIENDLKAETEFYNSDLIPTKDDYVTIDLTDTVFDVNKCDISVTQAKSLKLIENSNIVDALMPESSCNKLNCESFPETKNDRDVHDSCLKSVTVKCDSENLCGLSLCNNDNIHNFNLPLITKSEVEDVQLSGNSFLKFDDKNDSLEALTDSTPNMYDISVNNICNNLFDKTSHTKDSSVDADLFLKDMLTDIRSNAVSVIDSRPLNGESNLFDLLLSDGKKMKELVCELPVVDKDNLSNLLDSSEVQQSCSVSLADLANSHVFNNDPDKIGNDIDKNIPHLKNNLNHDSLSVDDFQSNLPGGKSKANFDIEEKYLSKPNNEAIKTKDFDEKQQFKDNLTRNETLDDEIEPDIDLNFCVRSPVIKNNYFDESSSSESRDSGFDETDLATIKSIIPSFQVSASGKKHEHEVSGHFLSKKRPSLFSIAISCKLNIEKSRRENLNKVRKELLKHSLPVAFVNFNLEDVPTVEKSRNSTDRNTCNREGNIEHVSEECEEFSNHMVFSGQ